MGLQMDNRPFDALAVLTAPYPDLTGDAGQWYDRIWTMLDGRHSTTLDDHVGLLSELLLELQEPAKALALLESHLRTAGRDYARERAWLAGHFARLRGERDSEKLKGCIVCLGIALQAVERHDDSLA